VHGNPNEGFEANTKILFRQTAAPTGWTKDTTYTDAALRVTSGTISQQAPSGKEFSTLFAARTIATANLPSHSHTFSGTTSTDGAHTHTYLATESPGSAVVAGGGALNNNTTKNTGSSGSHDHTYSGTTSSVGSGTAMDFAVNFVDVIIATRG
jgi:hypothetical protein